MNLCCGALSNALDANYATTGIGADPGKSPPDEESRVQCLDWFNRACAWLDANETQWKGVSDTDYGPRRCAAK